MVFNRVNWVYGVSRVHGSLIGFMGFWCLARGDPLIDAGSPRHPRYSK